MQVKAAIITAEKVLAPDKLGGVIKAQAIMMTKTIHTGTIFMLYCHSLLRAPSMKAACVFKYMAGGFSSLGANS